MQLTGLLHGAPLMRHVDFPVTEVLGPTATEAEIQDFINRHKLVFIKPVFKGGVGKKGKAGLIGKATDLRTALAERERLFFVEHRHGNATSKANGVTFEAGVPAEHEVYFSITDFNRLPRADDDADARGRRGHRRAGQEIHRPHPVRGADRAQGLRRRQRAVGHRRAQGDHLAFGATPAEAVGPVPPLWHDHAGAEPDPHGDRPRRAPHAQGLRLQRRLRPRRSALASAWSAGRELRRRHIGLRARGEPASHAPGPVGRVRHQPERHDPRPHVRGRRQLAGDRGAGRGSDHLVRLRRQPAL